MNVVHRDNLIELGRYRERERIIKLLEKSALDAYQDDATVAMNDGIKACLAIIKEENK